MKRSLSKIMSMLLAVIMLVGVLPMNIFAASIYDDSNGGSDYYNVISERSWDLAPGIKETELVLNNDDGTRRQVLHTATVDLNNPYTKVIAGYKGMWPKEGNYGVQSTSVQALEAEKLGVGNVVVATNTTLSWYTSQYYKDNPHLIGEPLGYTILDGEMYYNSSWKYNEETKKFTKGSADSTQTVIVINYDEHPLTGEPRPADMPKVWIRVTTDPLTGWEEQAIPVSFGLLIKPDANGNPVNLSKKEDHGSGIASRTFVGVKADGTLVITVSDGEQAPFSTGFTTYEMADYMIKMGCVVAANCDGGGSTTFCSQRPGEDLKVNCSLADGGERPTTSTILVITTAPADGTFARAQIESDYDYYTPGSSVNFSTLGMDAVGTKVDIPADVEWQIKESGMGTIESGIFQSNGTEGKATVQMLYEGKVVGEKTITIVTPDALSFEQPIVTIPFGKTAKIPVKATANINGVNFEIGLGENDVVFTTTNAALGSFNGLNFVAVDEANAPADTTSMVTATLNMGTKPTATVYLNLGKASEILWGFEGGQADIDIWNVINNRKDAAHWDYYLNLSLADRTNGKVHDGNYSMRLETNGLSSKDSHAEQYAWLRLGVEGEAITLKNARRVGFWLYVPEDNIQCWVQMHYMTDSNGDGVFDTENIVSVMESENVYYNVDESGWHYLSMDVSAFEEIALKAAKKYDKDPSDGMTGEKGEFFLALVFHKATNNLLWSDNGSINGNYTYYIDNFTVDYSEAVDDRENPIFDKIYLDGTTALVKRDVITTTSNVLNLSAAVADKDFLLDANKNKVQIYNVSGLNAATAKVYIDGVEVKSTFANGVISATATVADGYHRVKFEICDNAGNKSVVIRVVKVESGNNASTVKLVPADATLDRILFGSIYWMNLEATAIETIQSVSTVIDLNNVNHWELDHMELAEGFTATYTIDEETNTATITITRTGTNYDTGAAVLAKLPVRILYFDTDIKTPGYTAETYWKTFPFWAQDMKMDVDMGLITFTNGTTGTFSNEEFHVDTEMFTDKPHMAQEDYEYLNNHGTTHVHTPVALVDKAPNCVENGYTGRTFCEGCNSVVEWGTTIPATGHTFKVDVANRQLVCDCGRAFVGTGLQIVDGKGYYTVNGELTSEWITIDDEWYYFDTKTYSSVPTFFNGYVTYEFEADGKLVSGVWYKNSSGIRYYEGPSYLRGGKDAMTWYTIDGKEYCIEKSGYVATGTRWVNDYARQDIFTWYTFDENGVCQGKWNHTGLATWKGNTYYVKDGVSQYGMYLVDGEYYYFYFTDYYAGIKNNSFYCRYNNGLLPAGTYYFGYDGTMLNNDVYNVDGVLYYFVKGQISKGTGVFTYEDENYAIQADGKVCYTGHLFDASGKTLYYVDGFETEWVKNGVVIDPDGEVRYYVDGVAIRAGLVRDSKGNYYYINSSLKAVKNCTYAFTAAMSNGLLPAGEYQFDAEGKMINPPYVECAVHTWGNWFVKTPATVISVGTEIRECKLCDVFETREIAKLPCTHKWGGWVVTTPATQVATGVEAKACVNCGATEDREIPKLSSSSVKNGLIKDADGNLRYYVNGVATRAGLVKHNGHYYYINSSLKAVKNCSYAFNANMSNGLLPAGEYQFDVEGKMINPPVEKCSVHFFGEWILKVPATDIAEGLEERSCYYCGEIETREIPKVDITIDCNHKWGDWIIMTPATSVATGVEARACLICGKIETREIPAVSDSAVKNGLIKDADGDLRYYVNGVATRAGLVKHNGHYYYINSSLKAVKNCSYAFNANMSNGLLPAGEYQFDAEGKMINPPVDKCNRHFWSDWADDIRTCYYCGATQTRTEGDVPTECAHTWGEWVVITPATETAAGVETKTCSLCGATETRSIPKIEKPVDPSVKNGLIKDADGNIRYYVNGVATRAGLVQDADGNYYYINSSLKAVKNCKYAFSEKMSNGLLPAGEYQFDAEGKLVLNA